MFVRNVHFPVLILRGCSGNLGTDSEKSVLKDLYFTVDPLFQLAHVQSTLSEENQGIRLMLVIAIVIVAL